MTLSSWSERSVINAHLLNPAFCGEVLRRAIKGYTTAKEGSMPFPLVFVILPIVLHKKTRERLPRSTRGTIHAWLSDNNDLKIGLPERVKSLVPYTREALLFSFYHRKIDIFEAGELGLNSFRTRRIKEQETEEIVAIYKQSDFLGKWLASSGSVQSIYAFIGVKP